MFRAFHVFGFKENSKVDDSVTNESLTIYEALEAFYVHKVLYV
jgi:hypothetical protein